MLEMELISHPLCPYVQRAAITLREKQAAFRQTFVDLAAKPGWFLAISPLGKVPLLKVDGRVLFESAAICEYLDEVIAPRLHPEDPVTRAEHRAWIAVASSVLDMIAGLYSAPDEGAFNAKVEALTERFAGLERALGEGPFFAGDAFSLVDAAFAPVFPYFEVFEGFVKLGLFARTPKVAAWRRALSLRPSVRAAAVADYHDRLEAFLRARNSHLGRLVAQATAPARAAS